jgi:hypothetical protein
MDINEACRGVVYHHAEAEKEKLNGQIRVMLTYQNGGITKGTIEKICPLIPGAPSSPAYDEPGKNRG